MIPKTGKSFRFLPSIFMKEILLLSLIILHLKSPSKKFIVYKKKVYQIMFPISPLRNLAVSFQSLLPSCFTYQ